MDRGLRVEIPTTRAVERVCAPTTVDVDYAMIASSDHASIAGDDHVSATCDELSMAACSDHVAAACDELSRVTCSDHAIAAGDDTSRIAAKNDDDAISSPDFPESIIEKVSCHPDGIITAHYTLSARTTDNVATYTLGIYRGTASPSFVMDNRGALILADLLVTERYASTIPHHLILHREGDKMLRTYLWD